MFSRRCDSGMHFLHKELPHGNVTGSRRGYEHCGHCTNLTICRASFEACREVFEDVVLEVDELEVLERADRRESWVSLRGSEEAIDGSWCSAGPAVWLWILVIWCRP